MDTNNLISHYRQRLGINFDPSLYQAQIFDAIEHGRGNLVVEAVAGSGKTTTIVLAAKLIHGSGLFCAFNKHTARQLSDRLSGTAMSARTIHSVGFGSLRFNVTGSVRVQETKYKEMIRSFEREYKRQEAFDGEKLSEREIKAVDDEGFPYAATMRLIDLARLDLVEPGDDEGLVRLCAHHDLDVSDQLESYIFRMVWKALDLGRSRMCEIDFVDMIWLPVVHNLRPKTYSWVFVDEAQDLSKCQLAMVKKCVARGGRMVFVGDRRQAIYGFAGADSRSFQRIVDTMNAQVLPLSVCYRCPTSHIDLAKQLCPQIEAAPEAKPGLVDEIKFDSLIDRVSEGDMILCRINAPLLGVCYSLLAAGIAAGVRGRDIGAGLVKAVDDVNGYAPNWSEFGEAISHWQHDQVEKIRARGGDESVQESRLEAVHDKAECLRIMYARSKPSSAIELKESIERLFDNEHPSVVLSSVHRAKGLEEDRVFILEPNMLGRQRRSSLAWQYEQELNLKYVAFTRAKKDLVFVQKVNTQEGRSLYQ